VLEGFLSELLFDNIKIEKILESESNQESDDDKFNRVDILTINEKNEIIIIEIQSNYEIDYFHRMAYGVSKSISENLKLRESYSQIKKVISINIVYFDLGQGQDYVYKGKTDFIGIHQNDILDLSAKQKITFVKDRVSDIFPEYHLIKVNEFDDIAKDTLDEWIYFLKNSEVKDHFKAKGLKEAGEVLDIMRLPKADEYSYNRYLDSLHLKESEMFTLQTEAEFKVREDEKIELAKNGIIEGLNNEVLAKLTKLPIEKIEDIRKSIR
jgi:predicted transposase/invertase (TIGR01784 family)